MSAYVQLHDDGPGKRVACTVNDDNTYRQHVETYSSNAHNTNIDGQTRSASTLTLFDGKILDEEDGYKWDTKGTGATAFSAPGINMSVTSGQYSVRQGKTFCPYFSGKPQIFEATCVNFALQTNVLKRIGYFSSNAVAPYDSTKDGFWVEADGITDSTYKLVCSRAGTVTHSIAWTAWDAYADISGYDWTKFTILKAEFLWLGGAGLRLFMCVDGVFKLVHTIDNHAGYQDDVIFLAPNQPVRYEIRSSTGTGSMKAICAQVSTDGATANEQGEGQAVYSASIACNTVGTIYALCGARKAAAHRTHFVPVSEFGVTQTSGNSDAGMLLLLLNPTLSAPLTWSAVSHIEMAVATTQTVTNVGRVLKAVPLAGSAAAAQAPSAALRILATGIDNTMSELIVAYAPLTANQSVAGAMQVLEY
jgi:hypothetical protein